MDSFKNWIIKHHFLVLMAFVISILFGLFSFILEDVYEKDSKIVTADLNIAQYITNVREPLLNDFFLAVTQLGNPVPQGIAFIVTLILFFAYKKYTQLITIFLTVAGSGVITFVIKNFVQRARPVDGLILEHGFSFPSGHAFIAVCFWAVLFYLLSTLTKNKPLKYVLILSGILLAGLIGFSRVYIGVHWPSDVIASYLLSTAFTVIVIILVQNHTRIMQLLKR